MGTSEHIGIPIESRPSEAFDQHAEGIDWKRQVVRLTASGIGVTALVGATAGAILESLHNQAGAVQLCEATAESTALEDRKFTLIGWNGHNELGRQSRLEELEAMIDTYNPDAITIQEISKSGVDRICEYFPEWSLIGVKADLTPRPGKRGYFGNAIMARAAPTDIRSVKLDGTSSFDTIGMAVRVLPGIVGRAFVETLPSNQDQRPASPGISQTSNQCILKEDLPSREPIINWAAQAALALTKSLEDTEIKWEENRAGLAANYTVQIGNEPVAVTVATVHLTNREGGKRNAQATELRDFLGRLITDNEHVVMQGDFNMRPKQTKRRFGDIMRIADTDATHINEITIDYVMDSVLPGKYVKKAKVLDNTTDHRAMQYVLSVPDAESTNQKQFGQLQ